MYEEKKWHNTLIKINMALASSTEFRIKLNMDKISRLCFFCFCISTSFLLILLLPRNVLYYQIPFKAAIDVTETLCKVVSKDIPLL